MSEAISEKILIFIVAYNSEKTILDVLKRIPPSVAKLDHQILIIDDASKDTTFDTAVDSLNQFNDLSIKVLFNPENQDYGGNRKIGYHYAIEYGFDIVVVLHGSGQYAPEYLEKIITTLVHGKADAVVGSRMMKGFDALRGGMPFYRFVGNKILTGLQNRFLGCQLSEFHSGYRAYRVKSLSEIPFELNTNDFHFDTEILIQFLLKKYKIMEIPIPTYYGLETSHVNGLQYAWDVMRETIKSRLHLMSLFYERKFDVRQGIEKYELKQGYPSSHEYAINEVGDKASVLNIGCGNSLVGMELLRKGCHVEAIDYEDPKDKHKLKKFTRMDLDDMTASIPVDKFDCILLLDVLEHLNEPEKFVYNLRALSRGKCPQIIVSVPNIGFFIMRIQLLFGRFSYGIRGILDLGHRRLFTYRTIQDIFVQAGFKILEVKGIPAPYPLAIGENALSRVLLGINQFLIRLSPRLFSYQIFLTATPLPTLDELLKVNLESSQTRIDQLTQSEK